MKKKKFSCRRISMFCKSQNSNKAKKSPYVYMYKGGPLEKNFLITPDYLYYTQKWTMNFYRFKKIHLKGFQCCLPVKWFILG